MVKRGCKCRVYRADRVSANIIIRLKCDNYLFFDTVEKICFVSNCGVDDILEFTLDKNDNGQENSKWKWLTRQIEI